MTKPIVRVLLAAFNGEKFIAAQLDSILAQKDVRVLVDVRDDASDDATVAILERYARGSIVTLHRAPKPSGSAGRNFLSLILETPANGMDYVAFSDQDDYWYPDKLARACGHLARTGASGYSSATSARFADGSKKVLTQQRTATPGDFLFEGMGQGCTFVLTAEFYGRVREFLSRSAAQTSRIHYHDWTVYALCRCWSLAWYFDPMPSMDYIQHASNDTGARGSMSGVRRRLGLVRNGWYRGQLGAVADLCALAAPSDPIVSRWIRTFSPAPGPRRRLRVAWTVTRIGRRRWVDRLVLIAAALFGWI